MDNHFTESVDNDPIQDLMLAESRLSASFEAMTRVMDSCTALEQFVASNADLPTASFEAAARPMMMGILSGTGIDPLRDVSLESVKAMTSGVMKAILEAMRKFFIAILDYFATIDLSATWLMRKVVLLERKAASSRGKTAQEPTITLGRQYRYLRVGRDFADESLRLEAELKVYKNVLTVIGHEYLQAILSAATDVPTTARGKSGDELSAAMVHLVKAIPFDHLASKCHMTSVTTERFNRKDVQATPGLIGGKSLYYLRSDLDGKGIRGFKFHGFFFENSGRDDAKVDATRDFDTLSPAQIGNIPTQVRDILNTISRSANASTRSAVQRSKQTLDNFIQGQIGSDQDMDTLRKTISQLTYWMANPVQPLFLNAMNVSRAVIAYCDASIKTYR